MFSKCLHLYCHEIKPSYLFFFYFLNENRSNFCRLRKTTETVYGPYSWHISKDKKRLLKCFKVTSCDTCLQYSFTKSDQQFFYPFSFITTYPQISLNFIWFAHVDQFQCWSELYFTLIICKENFKGQFLSLSISTTVEQHWISTYTSEKIECIYPYLAQNHTTSNLFKINNTEKGINLSRLVCCVSFTDSIKLNHLKLSTVQQ